MTASPRVAEISLIRSRQPRSAFATGAFSPRYWRGNRIAAKDSTARANTSFATEAVMGVSPHARSAAGNRRRGRDLGNDMLMNIGQRRHDDVVRPRPAGKVDVLHLPMETGIGMDRRTDAVGEVVVLQPTHVAGGLARGDRVEG